MYSELLKLCGYTPDEIQKERPRLDRAFQILGVDNDDIKRAEERVRFYFDIELEGIRKILGVWMKQLVDLVLAREEGKKIIYPSYPPTPGIPAVVSLASQDIFCQSPEMVLDQTMGQIFGKLDPILEQAEKDVLPSGHANCSLIQARFGAISKGIIPLPDATLSAGYYCDQISKLDEYLHEHYGVHVIYCDGLMDSAWKEFPEITPRRVHYFATEIRNAVSELQKVLGMEFPEEAFKRSLKGNGQIWGLLESIISLMKADPAPLSNVDLALVVWMAMSLERRAIEEGIPAMTTLLEEAQQRVAQGKGKIVKGAPKIFLFSHHFSDPAFMRMIEDTGLCMVASRMCTLTATDRVKPTYTTFEERRAERQLRFGFYHSSSAQIYKAIEACREWNVAGAILFYHFACRPMNIPMFMMKKAMEEELGIPVLVLEGDFYDTRTYRVEALRTKVETFAEMLTVRESARA